MPVPFSMPMNVMVRRTGKLGDRAKAIPATALNKERNTSEFLRPRRSPAKLITIVPTAEPAKPVATTSPIAKDGSPEAEFLFVEEKNLVEQARLQDATPFDAPKIDAIKLNHRGPRCTFEAIIVDYSISDVAVRRLALIVRAADIKGQEGVAPEGIGLRSIAQGFAAMGLSDEDRLARQFPVYDALYAFAQSKQ